MNAIMNAETQRLIHKMSLDIDVMFDNLPNILDSISVHEIKTEETTM